MRISVVCCVYNGASFLRRQLESLVAQTRLPDEVVVVDDCSIDGSAPIIAAFARDRADVVRIVHVINERNLGLVANFEKGIGLADGDLIFLADQDDVWRPDKIAGVASLFDADPGPDFVFTDARLVDAHDVPLGHSLFQALEYNRDERELVATGDAFSALLRRNLATGATCAFRRRVFEWARPFPTAWVHDEWLGCVAAAVGRVACLDQPLIDYRQHASNQIGMRRLTLADKWQRLFVPRGQRYETMQRRVEVLVARLQALGPLVTPDKVAAASDKLAHVRVRRALSPHRIARIAPILRELAAGRYTRCARGLPDAVRDLASPA